MQLYYMYMQKIIQKSALHLFSHSSVAWEEAHEYPEHVSGQDAALRLTVEMYKKFVSVTSSQKTL